MMQPPPGWYPDPGNANQSRWWDGQAWSSHTAPASYGPWTPPPRRRIWPWIVFPLAGVLLLMGVCTAIVVPRVVGTFKHPVDAANVYLSDIRDGRLPDAYNQVCTSIRSTVPYDQYVQGVASEEGQVGRLVRFNAHQVHRVVGHSSEAVVDIDMTTTRQRYAVQARMVNENGRWHWCGRGLAPN